MFRTSPLLFGPRLTKPPAPSDGRRLRTVNPSIPDVGFQVICVVPVHPRPRSFPSHSFSHVFLFPFESSSFYNEFQSFLRPRAHVPESFSVSTTRTFTQTFSSRLKIPKSILCPITLVLQPPLVPFWVSLEPNPVTKKDTCD